MSHYDKDNVFAKILRDEISCHKVFESEKTLAFMDIMPRSNGHCLVIPKAFSRNIIDITKEYYIAVANTVHKLSLACMKAFNADGITIQQFNEPAGGQEVFHFHCHVIPCFEGQKIGSSNSKAETSDIILATNAKKIRAALGIFE